MSPVFPCLPGTLRTTAAPFDAPGVSCGNPCRRAVWLLVAGNHASCSSQCLNALERTNWNQTDAGKLLGVSRDTLRYRIKKFKLRSALSEVEADSAAPAPGDESS